MFSLLKKKVFAFIIQILLQSEDKIIKLGEACRIDDTHRGELFE